uniref:Dehydrogenase/reductase (SDR family) member 7Cb n=1 Tax=Cyclopterus lumpus TaxID=8103 RepID=A0A8C2ZBC7_CYCLU
MDLPSVMVLPLLIVVAAGLYYIYNKVMHFMSKSLVRNKVVVITDAVSGVGTECAHLFHKGGARLILCGSSWDKLESLYNYLTDGADPRETFTPKLVILDFSDMDSMEDVVAEVVDMKLKSPVQSVSLELDRNVMDMNYFGPYKICLISLQPCHTSFVCVCVCVCVTHTHLSDAASKHAAQAFFDCLRAEVEEYGIVVSTISLTFINPFELQPVEGPTPKQNTLALTHGVCPSALANEIMQTVNRKTKEVVLAHPIPRVALYLRSLLPSFPFAVLAAGVKDSVPDE